MRAFQVAKPPSGVGWGRRRLVRSIAFGLGVTSMLPLTPVLSVSSAAEPAGVVEADAARGVVPPRSWDAASVRLSDGALWAQVEASGGMAVVGLKEPDQARGVWKEDILIDAHGRRRAALAVGDIDGVSVIKGPGSVPTMSVKVAGVEALADLRDLGHVDYVEPLYVELDPQSGCNKKAYTLANMLDADKPDWSRQTASPQTSMGDWVPWNFDATKVRAAWARANGDDVTIGVIDTGLYAEQPQFGAEFASERSTNRTIKKMGPDRWWEWGHSPTADDQCGHGTRMAGTIGAPFDGRNMVGVAWKADLIVERAGDDVVLGLSNHSDVANAIDRIAWLERPRTIVAMAFGRYGELTAVKDAINRHPEVLFIAAAGSRTSSSSTGGCIPGWVYFPANMEPVVAVSGMEPGTNGISRQSCGGHETDIAPVIGEVPATGKGPGEQWLFGGSSDGTAVTAGIAALIWQTHPDKTAAQVRSHLLNTSDGSGSYQLGAGNPNAYKAVGGYLGVSVSGPSHVQPGASYTLTARPQGYGPFTYRWSTGETTPSITKRAGTTASGSQTVSVTVTDTKENKALQASKTVSWPVPDDDPIEPPTCWKCLSD